MSSAITDEELLITLINSDSFSLNSGTDLGKGNFGNDNADSEWALTIQLLR